MSFTASTEYYSGQGALYMAPFDTSLINVFTNNLSYLHLGDTSSVNISTTVAAATAQNRKTGLRGTTLSIATSARCYLTASLNNINIQNLKTSLNADQVDMPAITSDPFTRIVQQGQSVFIHRPGLSATSATRTLPTAKVLVENVHYILDKDTGEFYTMTDDEQIAAGEAGSRLSDDDTVVITTSGKKISRLDPISHKTNLYSFYFTGLNTANGNDPVIVQVFKVALNDVPTLDLINNDILSLDIRGEVLDFEDSPYPSNYFNVVKIDNT